MTRNDADDAGPEPLAVAISRKLEGDKQLRALVVGDSDWATNGLFNQYGNRDLALNAVGWLAGNDQSITVRPRRREPSTLAALTKEQRNMLSVGALNVVPMLLIACGLSIWSVRRSR